MVRQLVDFTSALYLGFRHPSRALPGYHRLTKGLPAVLSTGREERQLGNEVARLQGFRAGLVGSSTLHLYVDLVRRLARAPVSLLMDAYAYPVSRWAAVMVRAMGGQLVTFGHLDAAALERGLRRAHHRPVVMVDDYCPNCGRQVDLPRVYAAVRAHDGLLVVDTTQGLGVVGPAPTRGQPLGLGGRGVFAQTSTPTTGAVAIASLSKAFGTPLAVISGPPSLLRPMQRSGSFVHCSPPPRPAVDAGLRALRLAQSEEGDQRRRVLSARVTQLRRGLARMGLPSRGGSFPVLVVELAPSVVRRAHRALLAAGIATLPLAGHLGTDGGLGFALTARHRSAEVAGLLRELARLRLSRLCGEPWLGGRGR